MKQYEKFDEALLFGQTAQDRVADLLRLHGGLANKKEDRSRYDFELIYHNHPFRVEVKNEDRYASSGNICVEVRQGYDNRWSGIADSEAEVIIHTLAENLAIYRRKDMVRWMNLEIKQGRLVERTFGDNHNRGYVIAIKRLDELLWFDHCAFYQLPQSRLWTY